MKRTLAQAKKNNILRDANWICIYCSDPANEVDHILPFSYSENDSVDNLAASCSVCNCIAGSKVFDGFIEKQTYIREERRKKRWAKTIDIYQGMCAAVGLPLLPIKQTKTVKPKSKPKQYINLDGSSKRRKPQLPPIWKPPPELSEADRLMRKQHLQVLFRRAFDEMGFYTISAWEIYFSAKYEKVKSWRKVAEPYKISPNMARLIADGHEPGDKIRAILGLLPRATVPSILCSCGECFVSNHPNRIYCYTCHPFKSRKKSNE